MRNLFTLTLCLLSLKALGAGPEHKFYGFVKASALVSTKAVDSFGRSNLVAHTSAGNPVLSSNPDKPSQTFQVQQSRLGLESLYSENLKSLIEFDFLDFSKSSPTVASLVRLRRALVNIKKNSWTFNIGQDWDLFSPLAPHSYNLIGHYFSSGDLGFMRIQAQVLKKQGNLEHAIALGFPTYNNQISESTPEYSLLPTFAVRESLKLRNVTLGTSGIIGHLKDFNTQKNLTPYAVNLFVSHNSPGFELQSEAYWGTNVDNLSLQGLSYSPTLDKIEEYGFLITSKFKTTKHGYWIGYGMARITSDTQDNVLPSYTYNATTPVLGLAAGKSTGIGLLSNQTFRLGYDYSFHEKVKFYFEVSHLLSTHKLDPADSSLNPRRSSDVFELGIKMEI